ncbi:peptidyl-alpha-hydroxyglycine alpha-amidating lyase family protein [Qipengyuania sp. 6B39]|uniref:peptidyl-alpha-hydroxyglycine alpha-amidating lyase family protein n=1 Tax=Qipengyuania proteolytica TaxID=2867239 RepID=UPI001C8A486F|nr:peptidyl-alpha-hydroxyglycine alpha-amidating lyase family protein [Qipengyuania proteolytica]
MRRLIFVALAALGGCGDLPPEEAARAEVRTDWAQLPEDLAWGEVSAVDTDSHGHVFVLQRAGRKWVEPFPREPIAEPVVQMFAPNGVLLASWGAGQTVMPHGLSIDENDAVWITDVQREQVLRFSHDGELQGAWGERGVGGDDAGHFGRPADIALDPDTAFIGDGYVNSRLVVFDREGRFLRQWGRTGSGANGLSIPHSVAIEGDTIYVADRENRRIRLYGKDGTIVATLDTPGHPYAVKPLGAGWFVSLEGRDASDRSGAILRVWRPDLTVERVLDASAPQDTTKGHDLAIGADGTIFIADVEGGRLLTTTLAQDTAD